MTTLIFPGFSPKNQAWAEETSVLLGENQEPKVVYWQHWKTGVVKQGWIDQEAKRIISSFPESQVNVVAKSIGTAVVGEVIKMKPNWVRKLILCGIPVRDLKPEDKRYYEFLKIFPLENLKCYQNDNDNHGSIAEATQFVNGIRIGIQFEIKQRDDHEYPYAQEFKEFLGGE